VKTIPVQTGHVAYEEYGDGKPLVLLHANPGNHHDFDAVIPGLARNYRVIGIDWPGYGESSTPNPPQSASAMLMADVLEEVAAKLNLNQAIFIGNSVGGYAAARLAITQPKRVRALILVSPGGFTPQNLISGLFCRVKGSEHFTRMAATQFARFYMKGRNSFVEAILARTEAGRRNPATVAVDAAVWRSFTSPDHDLRQRAKAISVPTLITIGKYDPVIRANVDGKNAVASIPGSKLIITDTGHESFAEAPELFMNVVQTFLAQVESIPETQQQASPKGEYVPSYS